MDFINKAKESFLSFCISQNQFFKVGEHHRKIAEHLERVAITPGSRLIVNMPPRHGKSFLCSQYFPAWYLGNNPKNMVICASYGQSLANTFGRNVRNLMRAPDYKGVFGFGISDDSKAKNYFTTTEGGEYHATGRGGSITGKGGHLIIIDDVLKGEQEARSFKVREEMKTWYKNDLYTRLMPGGSIVIINTRWHLDDLCGWLLTESNDDWDLLSLKAIDEKGDALWPEFYPIETLQKIKAEQGSKSFEALYQQNPVPEEGNIIKHEWINYWHDLPARFDEIIQSWDLTFKGTDKADYVVGQVWGRWKAQFYLVDQVRGQWDFTKTIEEVKKLSAKYPKAQLKVFEDKANGPAIQSHLKKELVGIKMYNPKSSKEERVHSITPLFEGGNVFIPSNSSYKDGLVYEWTSFPNAPHDDQVDAMSQALLNLNKTTSKGFAFAGQSIFA